MKTRYLVTCIFVFSIAVLIPQAFAIGSPPPERVPATSYHIADLEGNSVDVTNVGTQITLSADLANAQDKEQFVIYVVEVYDYKDAKVHSGVIEGTLAPQMSFSPAVSWVPEKTGYYSIKFKILEDLETQSALSPYLYAEFHVIREGLDATKTRQWLYPDRECPEGKQVATKYDKSKNVCVFPDTLQKLDERGWTKDNVVSTFDYVIESDDVTYGSQYEISGGTIHEIIYDKDFNALVISFSESKKGYLQIVIQIGLLHSLDQSPFTYFVIVDEEEVSFEQLSPIILKIPFEKDTREIVIIGTN